jgi:hypothetical protein
MRIGDIVEKGFKPWDPLLKIELPEALQKQLDTLTGPVKQGVLQIACGVEIECEGVGSANGLDKAYWETDEDRSLRGDGLEFITKVGARISHMAWALQNFMSVANAHKYKISDRTSIHVHLNVLNLTMEQLNGLLIVYLICEQSLFNYASAHRKHNIFCVPLEAHLFGAECYSMKNLLDRGVKYSASNLKSVHTHGTLEFRHMETVYDFAPVWTWLILLGLLHRYATVTPLREIKAQVSALKVQSQYDQFLKQVFHSYAQYLRYDPIDLDRAVSDSKLLFFKDE